MQSVAGPGGFFGGGADAWLNSKVSVGLEAGMSVSLGAFGVKEIGPSEGYSSSDSASLLYSYSALDLTLWLGGTPP